MCAQETDSTKIGVTDVQLQNLSSSKLILPSVQLSFLSLSLLFFVYSCLRQVTSRI